MHRCGRDAIPLPQRQSFRALDPTYGTTLTGETHEHCTSAWTRLDEPGGGTAVACRDRIVSPRTFHGRPGHERFSIASARGRHAVQHDPILRSRMVVPHAYDSDTVDR